MNFTTKDKQVHKLRNLWLPNEKVGVGRECLAGTDQYLYVKIGAAVVV